MLWKQEEDEEVEEEEDCPIRKEGVVIETRKLRHNFTAFDIAMIPRETQLQTLSRRLHEEKIISQTDVMMKRNSTRILLILVTAQTRKVSVFCNIPLSPARFSSSANIPEGKRKLGK
jgi:hypothetical protein